MCSTPSLRSCGLASVSKSSHITRKSSTYGRYRLKRILRFCVQLAPMDAAMAGEFDIINTPAPAGERPLFRKQIFRTAS